MVSCIQSPDHRAFRSTLWGPGIVPGVAGPRLFSSHQPTNVWTDPVSVDTHKGLPGGQVLVCATFTCILGQTCV